MGFLLILGIPSSVFDVQALQGQVVDFCPTGQFPSLFARNKINRDCSPKATLRRANLQPLHVAICRRLASIPSLSRSGERGVTMSSFLFPQVTLSRLTPRVLSSSFRSTPVTAPPAIFIRPLFSYSYELLFPPARRILGGQSLCFDNHPHCPGVSPSHRPDVQTFRPGIP